MENWSVLVLWYVALFYIILRHVHRCVLQVSVGFDLPHVIAHLCIRGVANLYLVASIARKEASRTSA